MPIYRYECGCGIVLEAFRHIDERDDVPECCNRPMTRKITAPMIMPDIKPYRTAAFDKETGKRAIIESRRQHKEFLRRNDFVEIGNEPFKPAKRDDTQDAPMVDVEELKRRGFIEETY